MNPPALLFMNRSLTNLGLGSHNSSSVGLVHSRLAKFLPNRIPAHPIRGCSSELNMPSEFLAYKNRSSTNGSDSGVPCAEGEE